MRKLLKKPRPKTKMKIKDALMCVLFMSMTNSEANRIREITEAVCAVEVHNTGGCFLCNTENLKFIFLKFNGKALNFTIFQPYYERGDKRFSEFVKGDRFYTAYEKVLRNTKKERQTAFLSLSKK